MKRYCTVKEASDLLGVSTNTVYKYLKEGRLVSRRIGKGRFKILYSSLSPFINTSRIKGAEQTPEVVDDRKTNIFEENQESARVETFVEGSNGEENRLMARKSRYYLMATAWVLGIFVFGAFAIKSTNNRIVSDAKLVMQEDVNDLAKDINKKFERCCSLMTSVAGDKTTVDTIEKRDVGRATEIARKLYHELGSVQNIVMFDRNGNELGTYPLDTSARGVNYSSTEYFKQTKNSYKSYISNVITLNSGSLGIVHTEPVFKDNQFIGMLGAFSSLDNFSSLFDQANKQGKYEIDVVDGDGVYVYSTDAVKTGASGSLEKLSSRKSEANNKDLYYAQTAATIGWNVFYRMNEGYINNETSGFNVYIAVVLMVNLVMSFVVAKVLTSREKQLTNRKNVPSIPSVSSGHGVGVTSI